MHNQNKNIQRVLEIKLSNKIIKYKFKYKIKTYRIITTIYQIQNQIQISNLSSAYSGSFLPTSINASALLSLPKSK